MHAVSSLPFITMALMFPVTEPSVSSTAPRLTDFLFLRRIRISNGGLCGGVGGRRDSDPYLSFSPRRLKFDPGSGHVEFVVSRIALWGTW
jgi:hypothetical protein